MALVVVAVVSAYGRPRSETDLVGALGWYPLGVVLVGLVPPRMIEWVVGQDTSLPDQNQRQGGGVPRPARTKIYKILSRICVPCGQSLFSAIKSINNSKCRKCRSTINIFLHKSTN